MPTLSAAEVEAILLSQLASLGHTCLNDAVSCPEGVAHKREAYSDVLLTERFRAADQTQGTEVPTAP